MAILHAIKKWQSYLMGRHFIIKTDHHSLKYFLQNRASTHFQQKWVSKLLGFYYEIQYKQGCDNQVADALSRIPLDASVIQSSPPIDQLELLAISYPYLSWIDDLRRHIEQDSWILEKIQEM